MGKVLSCLIVDDEPLARMRLSAQIQSIQDAQVEAGSNWQVTLLGEAEYGQQAIEQVVALGPDLVLLDIQMPQMSGIEVARHLQKLERPPFVIFCTAYDEHALEAFKVAAIDYLLKPINQQDLASSFERISKLLSLRGAEGNRTGDGGTEDGGTGDRGTGNQIPSQQDSIGQLSQSDQLNHRRKHLSARTHQGIELIPLNDVRALVADQKYVSVFYGSESPMLIDESLKQLEEEFPERFVRVHRSALVSKQHIQGLTKLGDGGYCVVVDGYPDPIAISRRQFSEVKALVKML